MRPFHEDGVGQTDNEGVAGGWQWTVDVVALVT